MEGRIFTFTAGYDFPEELELAFEADDLIKTGKKLEVVDGHYPISAWLASRDEDGWYSFHVERLSKNGYWCMKGMRSPVIKRKDLGKWDINPVPILSELSFWVFRLFRKPD
jgi:hypothetical protein